MSRFGDLLGGKKPASAPAAPSAPEPVVVSTPPAEAIVPNLGEDTTKYEEIIEEEVVESHRNNISLENMSKKELEEYGRDLGVELDRRHSKKKLIGEIEEILGNF